MELMLRFIARLMRTGLAEQRLLPRIPFVFFALHVLFEEIRVNSFVITGLAHLRSRRQFGLGRFRHNRNLDNLLFLGTPLLPLFLLLPFVLLVLLASLLLLLLVLLAERAVLQASHASGEMPTLLALLPLGKCLLVAKVLVVLQLVLLHSHRLQLLVPMLELVELGPTSPLENTAQLCVVEHEVHGMKVLGLLGLRPQIDVMTLLVRTRTHQLLGRLVSHIQV